MKSQSNFFGSKFESAKCFGGNLSKAKGNPKTQRPLKKGKALHLVLRSTLATGVLSFLKPIRANRIERVVRSLGKKLGVKIYRFANSGNHLHILILPESREAYVKYVKALSGIIARITLGKERGSISEEKIKFWDARPFTRIVEWGRDFKRASKYIVQNTLEALGFITYQPRKRALASTE